VRIVVWLAEGTWPACVDAAVALAPPDAELTLLHVVDPQLAEHAHGAFTGLVGRGGRGRDPGSAITAAAAQAQEALLAAAADRIDRPALLQRRSGRLEREVVAAADGADLLVAARDGAHDRLGPRSLGPATRFVVDHAPCAVLLVWPDEPPGLQTIPPPPPHPPHGPHDGPPR
jgi:nucleotide-binding universal stress UspA family protein